jgi:cytoskeletal protein CcmA (bactofilin family)
MLSNSVNEQSIKDLLTINEDAITSVIDEGVTFKGTLICESGKSMLISGVVEGEVISNGNVVVNETGVVRGSIRARLVKLAGTIEKIEGHENVIRTDEAIVLAQTASLTADLLTFGGIQMAYGCKINARMETLPATAHRTAADLASDNVSKFPRVANQD